MYNMSLVFYLKAKGISLEPNPQIFIACSMERLGMRLVGITYMYTNFFSLKNTINPWLYLHVHVSGLVEERQVENLSNLNLVSLGNSQLRQTHTG